MGALERQHGLSGINTVARNRDLWDGYDWTEKGENWSPSPEWKQALIDEVLLANLEDGQDVIEIGPGAGRWTDALQARARTLTLVDVSQTCLDMCRTQFASAGNMRYVLSSGSDLSDVPDEKRRLHLVVRRLRPRQSGRHRGLPARLPAGAAAWRARRDSPRQTGPVRRGLPQQHDRRTLHRAAQEARSAISQAVRRVGTEWSIRRQVARRRHHRLWPLTSGRSAAQASGQLAPLIRVEKEP